MGFHGFSGHIWLPEGKWSKIFIWCQESGAQLPKAWDLENRRNGHPMFHYRIGMNPWCLWMFMDVYGCLWMFMDVYGDSLPMFGLGILKKKNDTCHVGPRCVDIPGVNAGVRGWRLRQHSSRAQENNPSRWSKGKRSVGNSAASWDLIGFYLRYIMIYPFISSYPNHILAPRIIKNLYLSDQPSHSSKGKGWTPQKRNR